MRRNVGLWLLLAAAGCHQVIGAERRTHEESGEDAGPIDGPGEDAGEDTPDADAPEDAGDGGEDAAGDGAVDREEECNVYCDEVLQACSGDNGTFSSGDAYGSADVCFAVCMRLPLGDFSEKSPSDNSVACRQRNARLANDLNDVEKRIYCPAAGPGGGTPGSAPLCGSNCEGYCSLYRSVCDDKLDEAECVRQCGALPDEGRVNAQADFMGFGDTIQCRLAHLSVAAYLDPDSHCGHARLVPDENNQVSCDLDTDSVPSCEDYCRLVGVGCTEELAVYESEAQCLAVCEAMPKGKGRDNSGHNLACRRWRGYAALLDPAVHCRNAGPAGSESSPCGSPCEAYCQLLDASTCTAPADCITQCEALSAEDTYTVAAGEAEGATLSCRLLQLSRALAGDAGACTGAEGGAPCN